MSEEDASAALPLAERAFALEPGNPNYADTLGTILSRLPGRMADARDVFSTCLSLTRPGSPEHARAQLQFARACVALGDAGAARVHLEQVRQADALAQLLTAEERDELQRLLRETAPSQ
jgi:hypothetical protein